jgi:hypothetical protein
MLINATRYSKTDVNKSESGCEAPAMGRSGWRGGKGNQGGDAADEEGLHE